MIQAINDEESEFNNCIKSLKTTITNLYYCVEQYTKGEAVVNNKLILEVEKVILSSPI